MLEPEVDERTRYHRGLAAQALNGTLEQGAYNADNEENEVIDGIQILRTHSLPGNSTGGLLDAPSTASGSTQVFQRPSDNPNRKFRIDERKSYAAFLEGFHGLRMHPKVNEFRSAPESHAASSTRASWLNFMRSIKAPTRPSDSSSTGNIEQDKSKYQKILKDTTNAVNKLLRRKKIGKN